MALIAELAGDLLHPLALRRGPSGLKPGLPVLGVEPRRLGLGQEPLEHDDETRRRLELGQVTHSLEDLESAARDVAVGVLAVVSGKIGSRAPQTIRTGTASAR